MSVDQLSRPMDRADKAAFSRLRGESLGVWKEFRAFAMKGNVVDLAVGVVIGAAFGKIVSSLVADVIMPPIGLVIGGVDFSGLQLTLKEATAAAPAVTVRYGVFLQAVIDFLIVAAAVFSVVKLLSRMQRKQAAAEAAGAAPLAPPVPSEEVKLLGEIRDLLRRDEAAART